MKFANNFNDLFNAQSGLKHNMSLFNETRWVKLNKEPIEITYNFNSEDDEEVKTGFYYNDEWFDMENFIRCRNNPWIGGDMDVPEYIHAFDGTDAFRPLYIELDDSGDYLNVYERIDDGE